MTKIAKAVQAKKATKATKTAAKPDAHAQATGNAQADTTTPPAPARTGDLAVDAAVDPSVLGTEGKVLDVAKTPDDYQPEATTVAPLPDPERDFRPQAGQKTKEMTVMLVAIKRGLEEIPGEFFKHELPLLRMIHLPENVRVVDPEYSAVDVLDSAGAELARLQSKYKQHRDKLAVVFPFAHSVAQATHLRDDGDEYGEAPQSVQIVNRRKPGAAR